MINPFKRKPEPYRFVWEEQPYAFVPGHVYVIQINTNQIMLKEVEELKKFFADSGVLVKLVAVRSNAEWALNPVSAVHRYGNE